MEVRLLKRCKQCEFNNNTNWNKKLSAGSATKKLYAAFCIKVGHNSTGGVHMSDFQKLTNLQSRIKKGTRLKQTSYDGENYVVHLTTDPPIVFDVKDEEKVNQVLHNLDQI